MEYYKIQVAAFMIYSCMMITCLIDDVTCTTDDDAPVLSSDSQMLANAENEYILEKLRQRRSEMALLPPMNSWYGDKLGRYIKLAPQKRQYRIWMPAQGYVNVPEEDISNFHGSHSGSKVFRYGRK